MQRERAGRRAPWCDHRRPAANGGRRRSGYEARLMCRRSRSRVCEGGACTNSNGTSITVGKHDPKGVFTVQVRLFAIVVALGVTTASSVAQQVASTIVFTSTRDNPGTVPPISGGEIYFIAHLSDGSFSTPQRVTRNAYADIFPALSPYGKGRIVFDSNRVRASSEPVNTSDLFLMNHDGTEPLFLTRGGSPSWSPAVRMVGRHK